MALALDVKTLSGQADSVVRGKVSKTAGKWVGKRIVTEVTITVDATFKGGEAREITLITPGGEVDGLAMKVSGAATFVPKEEVVVFLKEHKGQYGVLGLGQGKYKVERSPSGATARPEVGGLSLFKKNASGGVEETSAPSAKPLKDLEAEIKAALAQ
jgi:hypothetical protein